MDATGRETSRIGAIPAAIDRPGRTWPRSPIYYDVRDSLACHAYRPHTPVPLARCVQIQPSSVAVVEPVVMVMAPEVRRRVRRKSVSWSLSRRTRPAGPRPPPAVELVISNTCAAAAAAGGKLRRTATRWCSRLIRGMRRRGRLTFSRSRYRSDPRKVPREKALVLENHGEVLMENSARRAWWFRSFSGKIM